MQNSALVLSQPPHYPLSDAFLLYSPISPMFYYLGFPLPSSSLFSFPFQCLILRCWHSPGFHFSFLFPSQSLSCSCFHVSVVTSIPETPSAYLLTSPSQIPWCLTCSRPHLFFSSTFANHHLTWIGIFQFVFLASVSLSQIIPLLWLINTLWLENTDLFLFLTF